MLENELYKLKNTEVSQILGSENGIQYLQGLITLEYESNIYLNVL